MCFRRSLCVCGISSEHVDFFTSFLSLMCIFTSSSGVRLYFSTCPFRQPLARPNTLTLVHVRLPPGFSASSTVEKPSKVHKALYSKGKFCNAVRLKIFFKCLWVLCICVYSHHESVHCHRRSEERTRSGTEVFTGGSELPHGSWELNTGFLQEQQVLLTAELSFQF